MLEKQELKAAGAVEKGDKIWVWVPETHFGFFGEPGAAESKKFKLVSDSTK